MRQASPQDLQEAPRRRIFKSVSESLSESVFESVLAGRIRRLDPKLHIKRPQAADTLLPARSD